MNQQCGIKPMPLCALGIILFEGWMDNVTTAAWVHVFRVHLTIQAAFHSTRELSVIREPAATGRVEAVPSLQHIVATEMNLFVVQLRITAVNIWAFPMYWFIATDLTGSVVHDSSIATFLAERSSHFNHIVAASKLNRVVSFLSTALSVFVFHR